MMRGRPISLQLKLMIAFCVVIILTGGTVFLISYGLTRGTLTDHLFADLGAVLSRSKIDVETSVENSIEVLSLITSRDDLREAAAGEGNTAQLQSVLTTIRESVPNVRELAIITPQGLVTSSTDPSLLGESLADDPLYKGGKAGSYVGPVEDVGGELRLSLSDRLVDPGSGDLLGVLLMVEYPRLIDQTLRNTTGLGETGSVVLSEVRAGQVFSVSGLLVGGEEGPGRVFEVDSDTPEARSARGEDGEGTFEDEAGVEWFTVYTHIPETRWGMTARIRESEALGMLRGLTWRVMLALVGIFICGLLLAYLLARSLSRPIEELKGTVQLMGKGKLDHRVQRIGGREVAVLADEFNTMAERLAQSYRDLESKVEERTKELQIANERLLELDRLKNEFVSVASHELRSPLSAMKMGVTNILEGSAGPLNDEQRRILTLARGNIERLDRVTRDLLDITSIEAGGLELDRVPFELGELVTEVVVGLRPRVQEKGLYLRYEGSSEDIVVLADQDRIFQVISNLLDNAIKFTEEGGIGVLLIDGDREVMVCITDTGPGIEPDKQDRIFEKFSRAHLETEPVKRGTGLGLAICRGIIDAHGGRIWVESSPRRGSRFCFTIPRRRQH